MTTPRMRAGTSDRQGAVDRLTQHFADGRLDPDEFDDRMGKAYKATYLDEFPALFVDLPEAEPPRGAYVARCDAGRYRHWSDGHGGQDRPARPWGPPRGGPPRGLIVVAVVAALFWIGVLTHALFLLPLIWLAAIALGGRRRHQWQRSEYRRRSEHWQRRGSWQQPDHWQHR